MRWTSGTRLGHHLLYRLGGFGLGSGARLDQFKLILGHNQEYTELYIWNDHDRGMYKGLSNRKECPAECFPLGILHKYYRQNNTAKCLALSKINIARIAISVLLILLVNLNLVLYVQ